MQRATLIINESAGKRRELQALVPALVEALKRHEVDARAVLTDGAGHAQDLAAEAVASGCDAVFACGGDGTVHEVLQGLVGTTASLGVVPIGTANALARNLRLSMNPVKALEQQLAFKPRLIPAGELRCTTNEGEATRYFTVMAGAGPDGALVYGMLAGKRSGLGRSSYYAHAARLFFTRRFPPFRVAYRMLDSEDWIEEVGVSVMCARVADLGGAFKHLARGGLVSDAHLQLIVVKPPAHIALPAWFTLSSMGLHSRNPWLKSMKVAEFRCIPTAANQRIHAESDGEWLGYLPMSVRLLPNAVSLLMPEGLAIR